MKKYLLGLCAFFMPIIVKADVAVPETPPVEEVPTSTITLFCVLSAVIIAIVAYIVVKILNKKTSK